MVLEHPDKEKNATMIEIILTPGTNVASLRDRVLASFENHPALDYVTDEVVLANLPDLDNFLDEYPCLSIQFSGAQEHAICEDVHQLVDQWSNGFIDRTDRFMDLEEIEKMRAELGLADDNDLAADYAKLGEDIDAALEELSDRIVTNITDSWVDPADVARDLAVDWDAEVFELDGEHDDWEGFCAAVADEVVMSALTQDGREGEALYAPVDASEYRGTLA